MKYFLIAILFLFVSCSDNKITQNTTNIHTNTTIQEINNSNDVFILDSQSFEAYRSIPSSNISTNPTFLNSNSNYILSYGLTPELYLLESLNNLERYGYKLEYIPIELLDSMADGTISNGNYYISADDRIGYKALYYSPEYNQYYLVDEIGIVSNVHTLFSNINTNIQEPYYINHYHADPETNIIYIADINTNQRLYYKPDNNIYLLKEFWNIRDYEILYFTNSSTEAIRISLSSNIILHPYTNESNRLYYTNDTGIVFDRNIYENGLLSSDDTNFILELDDNVD